MIPNFKSLTIEEFMQVWSEDYFVDMTIILQQQWVFWSQDDQQHNYLFIQEDENNEGGRYILSLAQLIHKEDGNFAFEFPGVPLLVDDNLQVVKHHYLRKLQEFTGFDGTISPFPPK